MELIQEIVSGPTGLDLKSFVYRRVKDRALAEDIVQDVLLKVYMKIDQLKSMEKIRPWIYQITRNAITDHYRATSKPILANEFDWESERQVLNECASYCLSEMLATLPEKYRQALQLTEFENVSQTELADRLNISYSGAKSRVQRAKNMLKQKMEENYRIKLDPYGNVIQCQNKIPCNCSGSFSDACE